MLTETLPKKIIILLNQDEEESDEEENDGIDMKEEETDWTEGLPQIPEEDLPPAEEDLEALEDQEEFLEGDYL